MDLDRRAGAGAALVGARGAGVVGGADGAPGSLGLGREVPRLAGASSTRAWLMGTHGLSAGDDGADQPFEL